MAKRKAPKKKRRFANIFVKLVFGISVLLVLGYQSIRLGLFGPIPTAETLANIENSQATEILADDGQSLGFLYRTFRSDVKFDELPKHLINALVATEDARFYDHNGIDFRSLARVLVKTIVLQDKSAGGGSTLSQQLVKNLFPREYSTKLEILIIKIKEMLIAQRLEEAYSKEEILTFYLNTVSFPDNTFGIQAASRTFFNKDVAKLSVLEAATLVGSLKATYTYNPRIYPEQSHERRNVVLAQMEKYGKLSQEEFERLISESTNLDYHPMKADKGIAPYFREQVRKQMMDWAREYEQATGEAIDIYAEGLQIHTTLNKTMQVHAENAMKTHMQELQNTFEGNWGQLAPWKKKEIYQRFIQRTHHYRALKAAGKSEQEISEQLRKKQQMEVFDWSGSELQQLSVIDSIQHALKTLQAGFIAMDPGSGAVKTWVGGIEHEYFKFDHVSQSKRQVGSTFKPIVYTAALESGVKPCDYFPANAVEYENLEGWKPTNSDEEDYTYINVTMQEAMRKSMNTVSVRIMEECGIPKVVRQAKEMGIQSSLPEVPSLALGTAELSMLEMATAYTSFLNEGRSTEPLLITKITDRFGKVLMRNEHGRKLEQAFSDQSAQIILQIMQGVVDSGTASRLRWRYKLQNDIAGKTGTTQNNKDGWFVGLLPNLVTLSWVGADNGAIGFRSTSIGQGANSALPIFAIWMQKINGEKKLNYYTKAKFAKPSTSILNMMDCPPVKEDGFLKKLFKNPDKKEIFDAEGEKNQGLFKKLKKFLNGKN